MSRKSLRLLALAAGVCFAMSLGVGAEDPKSDANKGAHLKQEAGGTKLKQEHADAEGITQKAKEKADAEAAKAGGDPAAMSEADMMAAMGPYMTPGPEHAELAKMVGEWDTTIKMFWGPEPTESKGTATFKMILGGRYLVQEAKSPDMGGMPFEGHGMVGFDNGKKMYHSTWYDSMGTGVMVGTGTETDGVVTMKSTMYEPMAGMEVTTTEKSWHVDADTHMFEMYMPGPDGKEAKVMEITYKRKK